MVDNGEHGDQDDTNHQNIHVIQDDRGGSMLMFIPPPTPHSQCEFHTNTNTNTNTNVTSPTSHRQVLGKRVPSLGIK